MRGQMREQLKRYILPLFLVPCLIATLEAQPTRIQSPNPAPAMTQGGTPAQEIGGQKHAQFEVASIKQDTSHSNTASDNFDLGDGDELAPTGGFYTATNRPIWMLIEFAYKLSPLQTESLTQQLPEWAKSNRYDLEARAEGNPSKDDVRLMMQSLLAERFKLTLHLDSRQAPVFALVLDKPGRLGPRLRVHVDDPPCDDPSTSAAPTWIPGPDGFPTACGSVFPLRLDPPVPAAEVGARNITLATMARSFVPQAVGLDRPLADQTGLEGKYDFVLEWLPSGGAGPTPPPSVQDIPAFAEALRTELGLKLKPTTGIVEAVVLDRIDQLSPN